MFCADLTPHSHIKFFILLYLGAFFQQIKHYARILRAHFSHHSQLEPFSAAEYDLKLRFILCDIIPHPLLLHKSLVQLLATHNNAQLRFAQLRIVAHNEQLAH